MNGKTAKLCRRFAVVTGIGPDFSQNVRDVKRRFLALPKGERARKKADMRVAIRTLERISREGQ